MKHLFVPYELALKLKEKGFDERCIIYYNEGMLQLDASNTMFGWGVKDFEEPYMKDRERLPAPLYQQVIDWFREKHSIFISQENRTEHLIVRGWNRKTDKHFCGDSNTPNEALNKAIEEALSLL